MAAGVGERWFGKDTKSGQTHPTASVIWRFLITMTLCILFAIHQFTQCVTRARNRCVCVCLEIVPPQTLRSFVCAKRQREKWNGLRASQHYVATKRHSEYVRMRDWKQMRAHRGARLPTVDRIYIWLETRVFVTSRVCCFRHRIIYEWWRVSW